MAYEAKIICDSICNGNRLTTMQLTHPRIVHAEFNTHCMFARNAASSRAIPFKKILEMVERDPFVPEKFPLNQKGMQAQEWIEPDNHRYAQLAFKWLEGRSNAIQTAKDLADPASFNVHKQIVNRLLEPWMWITVCATGDQRAWENYFAQRCHPDAQFELKRQADMAQGLFYSHIPEKLEVGEWHLPYIGEEDMELASENILTQISVARCARTSYLSQEGKRDLEEDLKLYDRLAGQNPGHWSPFEHVCQAMTSGYPGVGKYIGWMSFRHQIPGATMSKFKPNLPQFRPESAEG